MYYTLQIIDGSGLTDKIHLFSLFYKLGKKLKLKYYHKPLEDRPLVIPNESRFGVKLSTSQKDHYTDIFDFMGIDAWFNRYNQGLDPKEFKTITFNFDEKTLAKHAIHDLEFLIQKVKQLIDQATAETDLKILFAFTLKTQIEQINWLLDLPNSLLDFNFKDIYLEHRKNNPWPDKFLPAETKVMIHIRQGDTATIKTPWNKYIQVWDWKNNMDKEFNSIEEINDSDIMPVDNYYNFYEKFVGAFGINKLSTQVHSDGFARTFFYLIRSFIQKQNSKGKLDSLLKSKKTYEKESFKGFKNLVNTQVFVGEKTEYLYDMIHAFFTADIIVVGTQNRMLQKLYAYAFIDDCAPLLLTLYHKKIPYYNYLGNAEMMQHCVFVDLENHDINEVVSETRQHLEKNYFN